jgi:hypothetical protein
MRPERVPVTLAWFRPALTEKEQAAAAYSHHPALLRLAELETLRALATSANARIDIGFDKHAANRAGNEDLSEAAAGA